jgi:hypothetical protein
MFVTARDVVGVRRVIHKEDGSFWILACSVQHPKGMQRPALFLLRILPHLIAHFSVPSSWHFRVFAGLVYGFRLLKYFSFSAPPADTVGFLRADLKFDASIIIPLTPDSCTFTYLIDSDIRGSEFTDTRMALSVNSVVFELHIFVFSRWHSTFHIPQDRFHKQWFKPSVSRRLCALQWYAIIYKGIRNFAR